MNEILDKINLENKTQFLYGEWGIGKTHFAKNGLYNKFKGETNVIYIDSRIFDQIEDVYSYLIQLISNYRENKEIFFDVAKSAGKATMNIFKWTLNTFVKTDFEYKSVVSNEENTLQTVISKTGDKGLLLIFDELDRITPNTILKVLNFINGLSIIQDKGLKIIAIGNKTELNSILKSNFGMVNSNNFLHKYFEREINLDNLYLTSILDVPSPFVDEDVNKDIKYLLEKICKKTRIIPRDLERAYKKINQNIKWCPIVFTNGVYYIMLLSYLGIDSKKFDTYTRQLFSSEYDLSINTTFGGRSEDKKDFNIRLENVYGREERKFLPLFDLWDNYAENFDDWYKYWFMKK